MSPDLSAKPNCSRCRRIVPPEDINVAKDIAYCRQCNHLTRLSSLVDPDEDGIESVPDRPPDGVWCDRGPLETRLGATHRSLPLAVGAFAFGAFWNGIVSIFVLIAIQSTVRHLGWILPEWFPAPDIKGEQMGVGMTLFLWIFLLPFIGVGLGMCGAFLGALVGKTEIRLDPRSASIFHGIGPIGWTRRFLPQEVVSVRLVDRVRRGSDGDESGREVVIRTRNGRKFSFGSTLREDRLRYLAGILRRQLPLRDGSV